MTTAGTRVANIYRLSPLQEVMLAGAASGSAAYQDQLVIHLEGELRSDLLAAAWDELVARHEALRTRFVTRPGQPPLQVVLCARPPERTELDLATLPEAARERELARIASAERRRPFDLEHAPLLRLLLVRLGTGRAVLVWTFHHIILDGWSKGVLLGELATAYADLRRGRPPTLPPAVPYRRFVRWREGQDRAAARHHWRQVLAGLAGATGLPASARGTGYDLAETTITLDAPTTAALEALAATHGLTPSALFLAAWAVVLARANDCDDIVFGCVSSGREGTFEGIEHAVGLLVNTLPIRLRIDRQESLLELAARAREATLAAALPAPLALAEIARDLGLPRVVDHLVDVLNYPFDLASMLARGGDAGFAVAKVEALDQTDLDLNVFAHFVGELRVSFNYNAAVHSAAALEAAGEHLFDLLRDAVVAPRSALGTRALLARWERRALAAARQAPVPATDTGDGPWPLSPHQERLWFIDRFERGTLYPGGPLYHNVPLVLRLVGSLDEGRLEQALVSLARRHPALRLRFGSRDGVPFQTLAPAETALTLRRGIGVPEPLSAALAAAAEPFEFDGGLLVRATLVTAPGAPPLLVLTGHHAVVDRASLAVIARDLAALYAGAALADLPASYLEVVAWERTSLGAVEAPALVHWRRHLQGLPTLVLPTDRPRPAVHTFTARRTALAVPAGLAGRLRELAAPGLGADLGTLLLAAFAALLARTSAQAEIVVGASDPRRERADFAPIVGPLSNLLVLRLATPPTSGFAALAAHCADALATAHGCGDVPFDRLVAALAPAKDMSRTALFDVLFAFEEVEPRRHVAGALTIERLDNFLGWGKYDLALVLWDESGGAGRELTGELVSNADLFDQASATRLVTHYLTMLAGLAAEPERAIARVACLSAEERRQLVAESTPAPVEFPREATLDRLIAEQAAGTPDAIAVSAGDHQLSYGGLRRRVHALARDLRRRGVAPESRVGLLLERDAELVVGLLAILEAGGAYVPLDPELPRERLERMLADAGIALVVTTAELAHQVPGCRTLRLDEPAQAAGDDDDAVPAGRQPRAQNAAYVIYTSGSTGRPKGVVVEHRQVVRLLRHEAPRFDFGPGDVWTLFHSASFDFSVWEIFAPLATGGRVVVVPKAVARDARAFVELLAAQRVTVLNQTPSSFANVSRVALAAGPTAMSPRPPSRLRYLIFGGEALQPRALADWMAEYPAVRVVNMYGITETTVHVTFKSIGPVEVAGNLGNVGRPLPTLAVVLLDQWLELVPLGSAGEIGVAGAGITRGYLGRPGLTADRFRPHPFGAGERLYRSGDLARQLPGGDLLYLGRGDQQVKVRGFRIEPGEIEHRLLEHPGVSAAAVLATASAGPGSDVQLVAHVVAPPELSVADLRAHLAERLPEHMVPARFVRLAALPLTATGKTDREVLALLPGAELRLGPVFEPPRDEREEALAASWREVLQRDPVGIHDSYFALGGDSIQAIQVAARLEARGLRLRIQDLFQHPTIATLAPHLTPVEKPAPGAEPTPGDVPLTPIQRWFFAMFAGTPPVEAASPLAFAHALVLRFARRYPREVVEGALQRVVSRHPALAFTFVRHDGGWVQRPGADGAVDLKVLELPADVDPAEVLEERAAERLAQLDLARSPLAATLFFGADADRLLLLVHHLVIDGVSWRVLLEDFGLALGGLSRGEEVELAPEVTSFARWAAEQAGAPPVEPSEARYWRALEAAIRPLSVDDPAGANRFRDGAEEVLRLSTELTAQLLGPANRAFGTSPEDLLLAGLAGALRGWPGGGPGRGTGGGPWVITLEGHGRVERAGELGRTIGWFTSRFPFALPLADEPVATRIKTVKEALRRVPAGGAGYGRLRYPRQGPADPPAPEPDLSFNYLGGVEAAAALAPFTLAPALGWRAGVNGELPRPSEIDLSVLARDGRLELRLGHSRERLRAATVAALGARWQRELAAIAEHCLPRRPEVTPADLSYAGISLEDLEGITS